MIAFTHRYLFLEPDHDHNNRNNQNKSTEYFLDHENPIINPPWYTMSEPK